MMYVVFCLFFKQKTAYEMRISDWSSDVCSSDLTIETLSAVSLDRLPHTDAATWLDKELVAGAPEPIRDAGFGREVRAAQSLRGQWLIAEGLADEHDGRTTYHPGMIAALQRRELLRVEGQRSEENTSELQSPRRPSDDGVCLTKTQVT